MKKVVSNSEVAHIWANYDSHDQTEATNANGSLYFKYDTIYSYGTHFPIAKHVENQHGEKAVLFTTRGYSNTTAKHLNQVSKACNHLNIIYCSRPTDSNSGNFEEWRKEIEAISKHLLKARKPEIHLQEINRQFDQAKRYADFFGIDVPANLQNLFDSVDTPEYRDILCAADEQRKEAERQFVRMQEQKTAEELEKWRRFETQYSRMHNRAGFDYLRYNPVSGFIETSQGLEFDLQACYLFHAHIIKTVKAGGCIDCNMDFLRYQVKQINKDFIQVGCHKIQLEEINKIAEKLNW